MNEIALAAAFVGTAAAAYEDQRTGRISTAIPGLMMGWGVGANGLNGLFAAVVVLAFGVIQNEKIKRAPFKWGDVLVLAGLAALLPPLWVLSTFALSVVFAWAWTKSAKIKDGKIRFAPFIFLALTVLLSAHFLAAS